MVTLNKRQTKILKFLSDKKDYITIKSLAKEFEVSERTIRYDLDNIEYLFKNKDVALIRAPRHGTKLDYKGERNKNIILDLLDSEEVSIYSQEERVLTVALLLLTESMTIEKLAEKLCVSKNTVTQDIKKVKSIYKNLNIYIDTKLYSGITIKGNEEDIRYAFMDIYYKSINSKSINIYNILSNIKNISKYEVEKLIQDVEMNLELKYSEGSCEELKVIILYTMNRIFNENYIDYEQEYIEQTVAKDEFKVIKKEIESISKKIDICDKEICYLLKWFKSVKIMSFIDKDDNKYENEVKHIAVKIVENMEEYIGIEFSKDIKFVNSVVMHFNVAVYRLKNNFIIENCLTEEIKYRIGLIYQITENTLRKYEKMLDVVFPDSEVAYMAMHFGAKFEESSNQIFRPKALLVCNSGLSTSGLLNSRINTMLPQVEVMGTCRVSNLEEELSKYQVDFVITTVPIANSEYKAVEVNPLLNRKDIEVLERLIFKTVYEKSNQYLVARYNSKENKSIASIINKSNAKFEVETNDWREAIQIAATSLLDSKDIQKEYIEEMIKVVENLGTYMVFIPEIAFIHAMPQYVNNNSVSLITLKDKIYLGDNSDVSIKSIIVLANKNENKNLIDLINILIKNNNVDKLKEAKNYKDLEDLV